MERDSSGQVNSISGDRKSPETEFWVSACNAISYIMATRAAWRAVISLIKRARGRGGCSNLYGPSSPIPQKKKKKKSISFIIRNYGELHWRWWHGVRLTERILHISSFVRWFFFKPQADLKDTGRRGAGKGFPFSSGGRLHLVPENGRGICMKTMLEAGILEATGLTRKALQHLLLPVSPLPWCWSGARGSRGRWRRQCLFQRSGRWEWGL